MTWWSTAKRSKGGALGVDDDVDFRPLDTILDKSHANIYRGVYGGWYEDHLKKSAYFR